MRPLLLLFFLLALPAFGQSTTVSGNITDAGGQVWFNGTYSFIFYPNPQYPLGNQYTWTGGPFNPTQNINGTLDSSGNYSASVPSNTAITPINSQWTLQVCPEGNPSQCKIFGPFTVSGATQTYSPTPPAIQVLPAGVFAVAYSDAEIYGYVEGSFYWNLTTPALRVYHNGAWQTIGGGGGGSGCTVPGNSPAVLYDTGTGCGDSGYFYSVSGGNGVPTLTGSSSGNDTVYFGSVLGTLVGFGSLNSTTTEEALFGYQQGSNRAFMSLSAGNGLPIMIFDSSVPAFELGTAGSSPIFQVNPTSGVITTNITGSTQCVQASSVGVLSGSGGACGGTSITLQHNGTNNGSQSLLNLAAGSNMTITDNGTGTLTLASGGGGGGGGVTSVAQTVPSWLTVSGSPITTAGTLAISPTSAQTSHEVIGTCGSATTFAPCALVPGDIPTLNQSTTGNAATATALAATPTQCIGSQFATGIAASGNANCSSPAGSGTVTHTAGPLTLGATGIGNGSADLAVNPNLIDLAALTAHNAQNATGASISSAGSTVTCSACTFTSGNIGQSLTMGLGGVGPGSGGAVLVTTISGFTSTHVVTVAATAGTTNLTGNNILWGTPDATAINSAISTLSGNGGGKLQIPCGYFYIDATIQTFPNITIEALGPSGEGSASQDCVTLFPAGNVTTTMQIGIGSSQQLQAPRIISLSLNDLFSQATNGFLVNGASNGIFDGTMARGFNGTGAAGYKFTFGGGSTQASTWAMNNAHGYDCTICVSASTLNVDGPQISAGEFVVKNTNANFTGVPIGIQGSAVGMDDRTHVIVGQNAGATQDAIGVQIVNSGSAANIQAKFEAQTTGHGIGMDFAASGTRGAGFFTCQGLATCVQFESGTASNIVFVSDGGGNNTQLVNELNSSPTNYVITQNFIVGPHHTTSTLPTASTTPKYAVALVTNGASGTDCSTGGGSTLVWCENGGSSWNPIGGGSGGGPGTGTQYAIAYWSTTGTLGSVTGYTGQIPVLQNAAPPVASSPGLPGAIVSASTYTIQCDSSTTTIDRLTTKIFTSSSGTTVTVPDAGTTGCGSNFTFAVVNASTGTVTVNRTTSSTFLIVDGSTVTNSATTFNLTTGQYATLNSYDGANYLVRAVK